jgi:DNA-binding MarR family transcriptional regulator
VATKDEDVFDAFVQIWSDWWSGVPDSLKRQESSVVARLLMLGLREGGIRQSDLQEELKMNQPHLSKLTDKLREAGWTKEKTAKADRRVKLIATAVKGQERLATLKEGLAHLLPATGATQTPAPSRKSTRSSGIRKRVVPQRGQGTFDLG